MSILFVPVQIAVREPHFRCDLCGVEKVIPIQDKTRFEFQERSQWDRDFKDEDGIYQLDYCTPPGWDWLPSGPWGMQKHFCPDCVKVAATRIRQALATQTERRS